MNEVKFKANIKDLASLQATVSEIPEIPTPATTDEGKVLTVSIDSSGETPVAEYGLAAPASGLPAIASGDAGKVLTVNESHTAAVWAAASGGSDIFQTVKTVQGSTILLDWQFDDIDNVYAAYAQWLQLGQEDLTSSKVTLQDDVTITISNEETVIDGKKSISDYEVYLNNLGITMTITSGGDLYLYSSTEPSIPSLTVTTATVLTVSDDLALAISLAGGGGR